MMDRDLWEFWGECDAKAQTAAWGTLYYTIIVTYI